MRWALLVKLLPERNAVAAKVPVLVRAEKMAFSSWMRSPWAGLKSVMVSRLVVLLRAALKRKMSHRAHP